MLAEKKGRHEPFSPVDPLPLSDEIEAGFNRYARILVEHAIDLRPKQRLAICGELGHRELALRIGEAAYSAGAGQVAYRLFDPQITSQIIRRAERDQIVLHQLETQTWFHDVLRTRSALILLTGKTDPNLQPTLRKHHPHTHRIFHQETAQLSAEFLHRALDQQLCASVLATAPTPGWARYLYPGTSAEKAFQNLAKKIFQFTFADRDDGLSHAVREARRLNQRARVLDALQIREIHVTGGGNDLRLSFDEAICWRTAEAVTEEGQRFCVNVPSFEVFTVPHRNKTNGRLVASRPIRVAGGVTVDGLELQFDRGRVVSATADRGIDAFRSWLEVDEGASYLGEFALVGEDSPIARSGETFHHLLLDENAASHVALGCGLTAALRDGRAMSLSELKARGCNRSSLHLDLAFGSTEVDIVASKTDRGPVTLIEGGEWRASAFEPAPAQRLMQATA